MGADAPTAHERGIRGQNTQRPAAANVPLRPASAARVIDESMKMAAARAIAAAVTDDELGHEYIIPSVFNRRVAPRVAHAVSEAARARGPSK